MISFLFPNEEKCERQRRPVFSLWRILFAAMFFFILQNDLQNSFKKMCKVVNVFSLRFGKIWKRIQIIVFITTLLNLFCTTYICATCCKRKLLMFIFVCKFVLICNIKITILLLQTNHILASFVIHSFSFLNISYLPGI